MSTKIQNYVEETAFKNVALEMKRLRLIFNDKDHETAFRLHFFGKSRNVTRLCVLGIIIISILSYPYDYFFADYRNDAEILFWRSMIRGIVQLPTAIVWLISTFRKKDNRYYGQSNHSPVNDWYARQRCFLLQVSYWRIGALSATLIALCMLVQTILAQRADHGLYMLYSFMIYLFAGIPFAFSLAITWSTYAVFIVSLYTLTQLEAEVQYGDGGTSQTLQLSALYLFITNGLLTIASYTLERGERIEFIHGMELKNQQSIIEGLLNNLLPVHVTDKLRNVSNNDYMIAEQVQECTILFSDMVAFTKWASTQQADVLIQRLHELYACFDELCMGHRVYKVETIGDAYFVSSNCPIMAADHADRCLMLGMNMMIECRKLDWAGYQPRMRIGIHTGPVMAGVVGRKMPRYHLFGGTVLIAEELESSGSPDFLHISEITKQCVSSDGWKLEPQGPKTVLHGSMTFNTYLVNLSEYLPPTTT